MTDRTTNDAVPHRSVLLAFRHRRLGAFAEQLSERAFQVERSAAAGPSSGVLRRSQGEFESILENSE